MSCGKCPEYKEGYQDIKIKEKELAPEAPPVAVPEPPKAKEKSWWEKLKDRIDPAGIGGLPQPSMGF